MCVSGEPKATPKKIKILQIRYEKRLNFGLYLPYEVVKRERYELYSFRRCFYYFCCRCYVTQRIQHDNVRYTIL